MYCSTTVVVQALGVCFLVASFSDLGGCSIVKIALAKHEYAENTSGPNTINNGLLSVEHENTNQQIVRRGISKYYAFRNVSVTYNGGRHIKIVNGKSINEKQHPFLAFVMVNNTFLCGGSIINLNYVLTAAHCLENVNSPHSKVKVILGLHDQWKPKNHQIYKVTHTLKHPEFSKMSGKSDNDIALLRLDRRIKLNDYVQPISLPTTNIRRYKTAYAQGWGWICYECTGSDSPRQTKVRVWSTGECANSPSRSMFSDPRLILCAGSGGTGTCHGDSGGPLFVETQKGQRILIGVVSQGEPPCAKPGYPDVYTRVESYLDWIAENTED